MSSYTLNGDDILLGGFWSSVKKVVVHSPVGQTAKFIAHPVKESKAAIKTIARFDPTAKSAKYGNITKGVLIGSALAGAALLTGGGALAVGAGMASAVVEGGKTAFTPVRKSPKTIAGNPLAAVQNLINPSLSSLPLNSFTDTPTSLTTRPADAQIAEQYATSNKTPSNTPVTVIGLGVVALGVAVLLLSKKKTSN